MKKWSYICFILLLVLTPILYYVMLLLALSVPNATIAIIFIPTFLLMIAGLGIYFGVINIIKKNANDKKIIEYIPIILNSVMAFIFIATLLLILETVLSYFISGY